MLRTSSKWASLALLSAALWCHPGEARAEARLAIGANYWMTKQGVFDLTLAIDTRLVSTLNVGGRFGGALAVDPEIIMVPVDLFLRFVLARRFYLEALGGAWVAIDPTELLGHFAFGIGIRTAGVNFGVELGYLDPRAIVGIKLAIPF